MPNTPRVKIPYPEEAADPWFDKFEQTMLALDEALYAAREDRNLVITGGGTISFDSTTGSLAWTDDIDIITPITGFSWRIAGPANITLADGQLAYLTIARGPQNTVAHSLVVGIAVPNEPSGDAQLLFARRKGTKAYFRGGYVLRDGESVELFDADAWGAVGGGGSTSIDTANTSVKQGYAEIDTTDATPVQVMFTDVGGGADFDTFPLPDNSRITIDLNATIVRAGGSKSKKFSVRRSLLVDGSSSVTANAQFNLIDPEEIGGTSTATVAIEYTGTNARVEFTGVAANEIRTRLDVQIETVTGPVFSGAAPTVSSVTPDIADPAGGSTHVIAGSDFTGVASLTIGGTNVPSFTVDSDTQITFTSPARAAGASLSVVATNPTGSNAANTLFEYWAPEQLPLTSFFDAIKSAWTGAGAPPTWTGIASAGSSGGRDVVQSTPANTPGVSSGAPDCDGTNDYLQGTATMGDLFASAQGTVLFVWDSDTQAAPSASFLDPAIFSDSGSYVGVFENTSGIGAYVLDTGGSRHPTTEIAVAPGTRRAGMARFNGTTLTVSIGASIDAASTACGDLHASAATGFILLGTNYSTAAFLDGRIRMVATLDGALDNASYTKFRKWAQAARGAA